MPGAQLTSPAKREAVVAKIWKPTDTTLSGEMVLPNHLQAGDGWTSHGTTDRDPDLASITIWEHPDGHHRLLLPGGWQAPDHTWQNAGSLADTPAAAWPTPDQLAPIEQPEIGVTDTDTQPSNDRSSTPIITSGLETTRPKIINWPFLAAVAAIIAVALGVNWFRNRDTEPDPDRLINVWAVIIGNDNITGNGWNSCRGTGPLADFRPGGQGEVQDRDGNLVGVARIGTIENLIPLMAMLESVTFKVSEEPDKEAALRQKLVNAYPRSCFLQIHIEGLPPRDLYKIVIGEESFIVDGTIGDGFSESGIAYRGNWQLGL